MQIILVQRLLSTIHSFPILGLALLLLLNNSMVQAETGSSEFSEKTSVGESNNTKHNAQIEKTVESIKEIQQTIESLRMEIKNSRKNSNHNRNNVKTFREGLELIDKKLEEAHSDLNKDRTEISANANNLNQQKRNLLTNTREIRANTTSLVSQKSLVEDNSIRLYELLIQISNTSEQVQQFSEELENVKNTDNAKESKLEVGDDINKVWQLFGIVLVFFIPLAFVISNRHPYKPLADGTEYHQGVLLVCIGAFLGYFIAGFGVMYGASTSGWIGTSTYLLENDALQPGRPFSEFLLYQTGFILLAAMIVYMAVGQQLSSIKHMLLALFVGAALIPIFGHWTWAGHFVVGNMGWLESKGFIDQAGATTINIIAACFALFLIMKLKRAFPPPQQAGEKFDGLVYPVGTVLLLWISWSGFTTGTLPISNEQISSVMLNVGLAGSMGGLTAFLYHFFFQGDRNNIAHGLGGFVSGLVAIAACAQSVTFVEAVAIGASAGLLQNFAYRFLRKFFLAQEWQKKAALLVAIHGAGGIWGTLCVALLGTEGSFSSPSTLQFNSRELQQR